MNSNRARRRVPDQLRKRAAVSCDLCKVRRRKCVRSTVQNSCELCVENKVECVSTIPRKPRTHLPNDESSPQAAHHRALEDLVGRLFPGLSINDTDQIFKLCQDIDNGTITIPEAHSVSPWSTYGNGEALSMPSYRPTIEYQQLSNPPTNAVHPSDGRPHPSTATTSFYERMLQNTSGTLSYFGSSSSMAYVRKMRELLAAGEKQDRESYPGTNQSLRSTFIEDKYARTMGEDKGTVPEIPAVDYVQVEAQRSTEQTTSRLVKLLEVLPSREETDELVEQFFAHVHINIALFHRPSFQAVLDRLRSPETSTIDVGWAVCVRLAVAFGCEWCLSTTTPQDSAEWDRMLSLRRQLVSDSFSEIPHLMLSGTLQSVTAFALFSLYMNFANERNAAWVLGGCAIRMATGLALHRGENVVQRSDIYLTPLEKELRKLIWCSLYMFEQYTSALFGRPSAVDGLENIIDLPKESILDQGFYWPPGYLEHDISLARIMGNIRGAQLDQSLTLSNDFQGLPNILTCRQLLQDLDDWRKNLPSFLRFDETEVDRIYPRHLRQIIMLHVRYQYARILLSRPFLLKALYIFHALGPESIINPQILEYKDICFKAGLDSWTLIHSLWEAKQYNASLWLDGVFAYQCNLILSLYLLDTLKTGDHLQFQKLQEMVVQIQAILQKGPGNRTMRRLIQISRDFSEIVASTPLESGPKDSFDDSRKSMRDDSTLSQQPSGTKYPKGSTSFGISDSQPSNPPVNWESLMESTIFQGDFMDGTFVFDPSADLPFEQLEFQGM